MTKKSVKEKNKTKGTKKKERDVTTKDTRSKTKEQSPSKKKRVAAKIGPMKRFPDLYAYLILALMFLFSLYLRAYKPMSRILVGDSVLFDGNDPWYHMMLAKSTALNLQRPWFDPLTVFPHGTSIHFGPFNSWGIVILSYIADLGTPSMHTVEVVGAVFPAILGALLVFPIYFIGREIGGRAGGLVANHCNGIIYPQTYYIL